MQNLPNEATNSRENGPKNKKGLVWIATATRLENDALEPKYAESQLCDGLLLWTNGHFTILNSIRRFCCLPLSVALSEMG